VIMKI